MTHQLPRLQQHLSDEVAAGSSTPSPGLVSSRPPLPSLTEAQDASAATVGAIDNEPAVLHNGAALNQPLTPDTTGGFTQPCVVSLLLAGFALLSSFSNPLSLIAVLVFGGYALYLYSGGRDISGVMPDGSPRARAWLAWAAVALITFLSGFTQPVAFLVALGTGAYAAYLFAGGRDVTREGIDGTTRSVAWLYWAGITVFFALFGFSHPAGLAIAAVTGLYSTYLFRGGRWVLWIW